MSEGAPRATKHLDGVAVEPKIAVDWRDRHDTCEMVAGFVDGDREHCEREADYLVAFEIDAQPGEPKNVITCKFCWPQLDELTVEPATTRP